MIQSPFMTGSSYALFPLTNGNLLKYLLNLLNICLLLDLQHHLQYLFPALGLQPLIPVQIPPLVHTLCSLPHLLNAKMGKVHHQPIPSWSSLIILGKSTSSYSFLPFLLSGQGLILSFCSLLFSTPCCTSTRLTSPLQPADLSSFFLADFYLNIVALEGNQKKQTTNHKPITAL